MRTTTLNIGGPHTAIHSEAHQYGVMLCDKRHRGHVHDSVLTLQDCVRICALVW